MGKVIGNAEERELNAVGPPTRKAENAQAAVWVWEKGEHARFFVNMRQDIPVFGKGNLTIIGAKADLKMMNYHAEDPETFAKQLSVAASIGK